ncbi:uncharacterized protein PFL1_00120 [Pseudozyma flocculosa PF-1]|uniref:uncharacterized protein n=1 Tax=Pseudozyma flocculosa PF-1 TaxID=1277687 RepID=UPI0004560E3B|nr:uncharacterized protein PFL1_00120 [Pseudozyma flocculosa PF-1]EPQ31921.1 hypothetical protein PFL1_00120 [Pseudozyma flocculosa PF-1]
MKTSTFTYASRYDGELDVKLDLHVPDSASASSSAPLPVVVWFHGGGLIQGSRNKMPPHIQRAVDRYGIAVVSPDYRLAPQCRAPGILDDVSDLLAFLVDKLPASLPSSAPKLDLDRIVLTGSSAGGWLALLLGLGMCPRTRPELLARVDAIAGIYPITTMDHPFFLEKRVPFLGPLANPPSEFAEYVDPDAPATANTFEDRKRSNFYMHAQREGIFPALLFTDQQRNDEGWLQKTDVPAFVRSSSEAQRKAWPAIYTIHGAPDTAVDVDQSRKLKAALDAVGVPSTYDEVPDKEHLWDEFEPQDDMPAFWNFVTGRFSGAPSKI